VAALTFVPGVGFRHPGVRLATTASAERDGLTLTVRELVSAPEGTDLTYDISDGSQGGACIIPGKGQNAFDAGRIVFRVADTEHGGMMLRSARVIAGGIRYVCAGGQPLRATTDHIELQVTGGYYGDWSVPLDLVAFTADEGALRKLDATATHAGISVHVRGISTTQAATALSIAMTSDAGAQRMCGLGGLHSMRDGPSRLRLRDEHGRTYAEVAQPDAVRDGGAELAVFEPLAVDANELELEVPFVYVDEALAPVSVSLPVHAPVDVMLGAYPIRVLSSGPAPDSRRRQNFGPALAIRLELGAWHGDRRVLYPTRATIDGQDRGMGWGDGINTTDPTPVTTIEFRPDPESPKLLTLSGGTLQVRGPWLLKFPLGSR
jgi:hypothetical protein